MAVVVEEATWLLSGPTDAEFPRDMHRDDQAWPLETEPSVERAQRQEPVRAEGSFVRLSPCADLSHTRAVFPP